jgi:hypothetical protein
MSYEVPIQKQQVGNLQDELLTLQSKISALESRLHRDSPVEHLPIKTNIRRRSISTGKSKASPKSLKRVGSSEKLLQHIARSEKELSHLETSLTRSPRNASISYDTEAKKGEAAKLKMQNAQLTREIEGLKKKLGEKAELQHKFRELQQEYNSVAQSFERSEQIRRKQKEIISQLKAALTFNADDPAPTVKTIRRPKVVVKRKKSAKRSRSNQKTLARY